MEDKGKGADKGMLTTVLCIQALHKKKQVYNYNSQCKIHKNVDGLSVSVVYKSGRFVTSLTENMHINCACFCTFQHLKKTA